MSIERERKYLCKFFPEITGNCPKLEIKQGYMFNDDGKQFRIRLIDGKTAYVTLKVDLSDGLRHEFEYQVPYEDGIVMFGLCDYKLMKYRHIVIDEDNYKVVIDEYPSGLKVVEIEQQHGDIVPLDFCGKDVTGVKKYSNTYLAKNGENEEFV